MNSSLQKIRVSTNLLEDIRAAKYEQLHALEKGHEYSLAVFSHQLQGSHSSIPWLQYSCKWKSVNIHPSFIIQQSSKAASIASVFNTISNLSTNISPWMVVILTITSPQSKYCLDSHKFAIKEVASHMTSYKFNHSFVKQTNSSQLSHRSKLSYKNKL